MAFSLTFAVSAWCRAEESAAAPQRGLTLLDCATFFGLISQADSPHADAMKALSFSAIRYSQVLIQDPHVFEKEAGKSMVRTAEKLSLLQKEKEVFEKEFQGCVSEIELAERDLRPQMGEVMKALIPEMFSQSNSHSAQPTAPRGAPQAARP